MLLRFCHYYYTIMHEYGSVEVPLTKKNDWIVCFDKHHNIAVEFYNRLKLPHYMLILVTDNPIPKNPKILKCNRSDDILLNLLARSKVFVTFETFDYTHFNIHLALQCYNKCVVPKFYQDDWKDDCCLFYNPADNTYIEKVRNLLNLTVFQHEKLAENDCFLSPDSID